MSVEFLAKGDCTSQSRQAHDSVDGLEHRPPSSVSIRIRYRPADTTYCLRMPRRIVFGVG